MKSSVDDKPDVVDMSHLVQEEIDLMVDIASQLQKLSSAITDLSNLKDYYIKRSFLRSFKDSLRKVTEGRETITARLCLLFQKLTIVLDILKPSSINILDAWWNENNLAGTKELLVKCLELAPLFLTILTFPKVHNEKDIQSTTRNLSFSSREYYDVYPVLSDRESGNLKDIIDFSLIYKRYVDDFDDRCDCIQYLEELTGLLNSSLESAVTLFDVTSRKEKAATGAISVIVKDSEAFFHIIALVATILLPESVNVSLGDLFKLNFFKRVEYCTSGSSTSSSVPGLDFCSASKMDGYIVGVSQTSSFQLFPVQVRQGIGLQSLAKVRQIVQEQLIYENTFTCLQSLICSLLAGCSTSGGCIVFLSGGITYLMDLAMKLDEMSFVDSSDGKLNITLAKNTRKRGVILNRNGQPIEGVEEKTLVELKLPVSLKVYPIDVEDSSDHYQVISAQIRLLCLMCNQLKKESGLNGFLY
jgi:hypothetical protein